MEPYTANIDDPTCQKCHRALPVQPRARTGPWTGHHYIRCNSCAWFLPFALSATPRKPIVPRPTPSTAKRQPAAGQCKGTSCTKAAHGRCKNSRCCNCCVELWTSTREGCTVPDHKLESLSTHQRNKLSSHGPSLPSSQAGPSSSSLPQASPALELQRRPQTSVCPPSPPFVFNPNDTTTFKEFAKMIEDENPLCELQRYGALREEEEQLEHLKDLHEQEEDEWAEQEHQQLLSDTRAVLFESCAALASPASSTTSTSSNTPPRPHSVASGPSSLVIAGIPVTKATVKKTPAITRQMNADWMQPYEDKSKLQLQPTGKGQLDPELVQKFRVIWWDSDDNEPVVFTVLQCPHWPKWKIDDCPTTKERLGALPVQFYDTDTFLWVEIPFSYPFTLKTDTYLLLRHSGVKCRNFEEQLKVTQRRPDNQQIYMSSVRRPLKTSNTRLLPLCAAASEDSEDEVEFVDPPANKRGHKRRRLSTSSSLPGSSSTNPISISNSPQNSVIPPFPSFSNSLSPSPSLSPPSPDGLPTTVLPFKGPLPTIPGHPGPWPKNMYACDMADGFQRMKALKDQGGNYHDRFCDTFGQVPPRDSTYFDQVQRWRRATEELRQKARCAGRTPAGYWSAFSVLVPLK